jgi:phosphatidylglycerol:prolipoprotein diacylglycerol transferase
VYPILYEFGTIEIGGAKIPVLIGGYGVLFALAIGVAWIGTILLGRKLSREAPWTDLFFVTIFSGVVGAKLANLLAFLPEVLAGRKPIAGLVTGGGVWLGGVAAGFVALWLMARHYGIRLGAVLNMVFVYLPLAHALGRIGCFLGGCCWGKPTDLPWAVTYTDPAANRLNGTPLGVPVHPTVLYEAGLETGNFFLMLSLWRRKVPDGAIAAAWMGLYGTERFFLEFLRGDPRGRLGPFSPSQAFSAALAAVAFGWLFRNRRRILSVGRPSSPR